MFWREILTGLPEISLIMAALIALVRSAIKEEDSFPVINFYAFIALGIAFLLTFFIPEQDATGFYGLFVTNAYTQFFKQIILLTVMAVLMISYRYLENENLDKPEYPILVLLATAGMMFMISANDLITFFMGLELQSLSVYILVAFQRDHAPATESALKYFILGALSTVFILYGCSLIYGELGSTDFLHLKTMLKTQPGISIGIQLGVLLLLVGTGFKLSLVPFHMWTPDVYQGSPMSVTVLLGSAPKAAAIAILTRLILEVFNPVLDFSVVFLTVLSICSMIWGTFAALLQKNIKRMLAFSTISHMGYAMLGIVGGHFEGLLSVLIYTSLYLVMTLGFFACLLSCRRHGKQIEELEGLANLASDKPLIAGVMTVILFSFAGIPPLAGFLAKFGIFSAALQKGFYGLVIVGVLTSVVGAAFYLKIIKTMYFSRPAEGAVNVRLFDAVPRETLIIILLSVFIVIGYSISPGWLDGAAYKATKALFYRIA